MSLRSRRWLAVILLLCMPFQALSALDGMLCQEQGYGDSGVAAALEHDIDAGEHDQMDFGDLSFDSCALCHLGCAPLDLGPSSDSRFERTHVFVPVLAAACIEHDPTLLKRPPRHPLA